MCMCIHMIIIHMSMKKNKEKIKQVHVAHQSRTPHVKTLVPTWHVQQEVVSPITYSTINPSCLSYICTNF